MPRLTPSYYMAVSLFKDELTKSQKNNYFDHSVAIDNGGSIAVFFENVKNRLLKTVRSEEFGGERYEEIAEVIENFPRYVRTTDFFPEKNWKRFYEKATEFENTWKNIDQYLAETEELPESYEELHSMITNFLQAQKKLYTPKIVPALITFRAFEVMAEFTGDLEYMVQSYQDPAYSHEEEFAALYPELSPGLVTQNLTDTNNIIDPRSCASKFSIDTAVKFRERMLKNPEKSPNINLQESISLVKSKSSKIYGTPRFVDFIEDQCRTQIESALLA